MTRLYAVAASAQDVAVHFETEIPTSMQMRPEHIEGNPGIVAHEHAGKRTMKQLTWGFPRRTREMRLRGDPHGRIGLVADLTNAMWAHIVVDTRYRCLIPLTHFANPDGGPGEKTRTWFSLKDEPLVAWAGFCRNTEQFGPVYAGMTMTANSLIEPYNERMPVLLGRDEYDAWLHAPIADVIFKFQHRDPPPSDRFIVEHTDDRWKSGNLPPSAQPQGALL